MYLQSKTVSGVKWNTLSTIFLALFGIVKISILARFLDSSDFGLMAIVMFVLGFMDLFMDMGLTSAILHKQKISDNEYDSLYWINIIFSLILFILIAIASPLIASFYQEPELSSLIQLMAISIILSALGRQYKTIEQKHLNFKYIAIVDIIGAVAGLLVGIVTAVQGFGVYVLVYSALVQYSISNGIFFIYGIRKRRLSFRFRYKETKPFLKIGIYQVGGQVVNYFNRDLDILFIGKLFGTEILGGYSLAKQLVQRPMQIFNPIISKVATPILAIFQNDKEQLKNKFLSFLNNLVTVNFIAYFLLILFAYPVVMLFFGNDFLNIIVLVQILSVHMFFRSVGSFLGTLITATGRTDVEFYWNLFVLLVSPIVIFIGAQFSVEKVALSLVISMIILFYPSWKLLVYKNCGASFREYLNSYKPRWGELASLFKNIA